MIKIDTNHVKAVQNTIIWNLLRRWPDTEVGNRLAWNTKDIWEDKAVRKMMNTLSTHGVEVTRDDNLSYGVYSLAMVLND